MKRNKVKIIVLSIVAAIAVALLILSIVQRVALKDRQTEETAAYIGAGVTITQGIQYNKGGVLFG